MSGKVDSGMGDDVSKEGKLVESVETLMVGIINMNPSLKGNERSGSLCFLGVSKGATGGGKGGGNDKKRK